MVRIEKCVLLIPSEGIPCDYVVQVLIALSSVQAPAVNVSHSLSALQVPGCWPVDDNLFRPCGHDPVKIKTIRK